MIDDTSIPAETPSLSVSDTLGSRTVPIDVSPFTIGRRTTASLQVVSPDVSRTHAEITRDGNQYFLQDAGSRFGTFLNGDPVTVPTPLKSGDRIGLGTRDDVRIVFQADAGSVGSILSTGAHGSDLRQLSAILDGLRALGSGRVLDEVLTLVVDSALEVTRAERGFIMLADASGNLGMTVARGRGKETVAENSFATSEKIPREVFTTGRSRIVSDLLDSSLLEAHGGTVAAGVRHVLCVPLMVAPPSAAPAQAVQAKPIGVLYLDGRERAALVSSDVQASLDAFATQAALAIESARLYASAAEKTKLERDLRVAAEIQQRLLPDPLFQRGSMDLAASSVPCRTIGGDFFDYLELPDGGFGFALGDVAGKGAPAALLAAAVQSNFAAQAQIVDDPGAMMAALNLALRRRAVDARFATMFYGSLDDQGQLAYSNAGQEPPIVVRAGGAIEELDRGGPVLGLLDGLTYETGVITLAPGDLVVAYSDGVTEASNTAGDEYGRDRLVAELAPRHGQASDLVLSALLQSIKDFAGDAPPADDVTVLILRYQA